MPSKLGFKTMVDKAVGTEVHRQLLSSNDWFYSALSRRLLKEYYKKHAMGANEEVDGKMLRFDDEVAGTFRKVHEPMAERVEHSNGMTDQGTSAAVLETIKNPQDVVEMKQLCEPEITYLISMLKKKSEKWESKEVLKELSLQASHTAKILTKEMIEGRTPICYLID